MRIPLACGADLGIVEAEHQAVMRPLARVLDTDPGTEFEAETYAEARALDGIWAINERLRGALIPERMLETLTDWEEACGLRPGDRDSDNARRAAVAAKLRGLSGNARPDIAAAAAKAAGIAYVDILSRAPADDVTYWPGINPGPPGFEWSSNRAIVGVQLTQDGQSVSQYRTAQSSVGLTMDAMLPAWMGFRVGSGAGFLAGVGIVGETYI